MFETYTRSNTDTYSEARARYVMGKVYDHLVSLYMRGIITKDHADQMRNDILYLMDKKAITFFEIQFKTLTGREIGGLHYEVRADSTISMDEDSGGVDFWGLDKNNTVASLLVWLNRASPNITEVDRQLAEWGWGSGAALAGSSQPSKSFSKDGFGLKESIIGKW